MTGALLLLGGLVVAVILVIRSRAAPRGPAQADGHGVRRFFQYLLLLGLGVISAMGTSGLLAALLGRGSTATIDDSSIARSVAFAVVGLPLLTGVVLWSRRTFERNPAEPASFAWAFYLSVASLISLVVTVFAWHDVLSWVAQLRRFDPAALADGLVWTSVWVVHWWLASRRCDARHIQVHYLAGSLFGLVTAAVGLGVVITGMFEKWLGLDTTSLIAGHHDPILEGALTLIVGAPVWALYWLLTARRSERDGMWHAYVLLVGVAGGLVVSLSTGSLALHSLLVWLVGDPWTRDAGRYFDGLPPLLAAAVVGLLVLLYHREVVRERGGTPGDNEVARVRDYLMAGIGLGCSSAGTTILLVAAAEAIVGRSMGSEGSINTLIAAITLLGVGGPVWWVFWRRRQRAARAVPQAELVSPSRRIYLFLLLGIGSLAAVVALVVGTYLLVDDLLEGVAGEGTLHRTRFPIGVFSTGAAVAAYHWSVYRAERESARTREHGPRFVLLLGVGDGDLAAAVARRTGGKTLTWARLDEAPETWSEGAVLEAIDSVDADELVVFSDSGRLRAVPVDRRPRVDVVSHLVEVPD